MRTGMAVAAVALGAALASAGAAPRLDYSRVALNVLPPGQSGSFAFPRNATDQLELEATRGAEPSGWRANAAAERTSFGLLPRTMRFANRPTFQQAITFTSHRPRR